MVATIDPHFHILDVHWSARGQSGFDGAAQDVDTVKLDFPEEGVAIQEVDKGVERKLSVIVNHTRSPEPRITGRLVLVKNSIIPIEAIEDGQEWYTLLGRGTNADFGEFRSMS